MSPRWQSLHGRREALSPLLAEVKAALATGKYVYCEAPLGNGLAEAKKWLGSSVKWARSTSPDCSAYGPEVLCLRTLIDDGFVGEVLSSAMIGWDGK